MLCHESSDYCMKAIALRIMQGRPTETSAEHVTCMETAKATCICSKYSAVCGSCWCGKGNCCSENEDEDAGSEGPPGSLYRERNIQAPAAGASEV